MTYNFDPERWYEDQMARLGLEHRSGRLSDLQYEEAVQDVERRYDKLVGRLDGTFDLSPGTVPPGAAGGNDSRGE
ncbi:MAG TPA: hypothetical protein VK911_02790 [Vicinamibacterales bacterium]|nr:hypothetical protein [Vicinamibacterales bacterium]